MENQAIDRMGPTRKGLQKPRVNSGAGSSQTNLNLGLSPSLV